MTRYLRLLALITVTMIFLVSCKPYKEFKAKFTNQIFTNIEITVEGHGSRIIAPGATTIFDIDSGEDDYTFHAQTSGEDSFGNLVGLLLEWNYTLDIAGDEHTTDLGTENNIFFLKMRNEGTHNLTPLYVNYESADQSVDNIILPHDGVTYAIGYYHAYINTKVKALWQDSPTNFTYWIHGTHFTLPWTNNQSVTLWNDLRSDAKSPQEGSSEVTAENHPLNTTGCGTRQTLAPNSVN